MTCSRNNGLTDQRALLLAAALAVLMAAGLEPGDGLVEVIKRAGNIPEEPPAGLKRFVATMGDLFTPILVVSAAVAPLAAGVGVVMTQFGSRKGPVVVLAALGGLVFIASINGLVY